MTKTPDDKKARGNLAALLFASIRTYDLATRTLGPLKFKEISNAADKLFRLDVPNINSVNDVELVRAFLRAVAWLPNSDEVINQVQLTGEQVSLVSDDELNTFAQLYLSEIEKRKDIIDSISELAAFIRAERTSNNNYIKEFAETATRVSSMSEVMKNWPLFQKRGDVAVGQMTLDITKFLGEEVVNKSEINKFLRQADEESKQTNVKFETTVLPVQRTADAVEQLVAAGGRFEQSIGLIVVQVGNVSQLISQAVNIIETAAATSQDDTKKSLKWALITLCAAVVLSAIGLYMDYRYSTSNNQASESTIKELQTQNKYLLKLIETQNIKAADREAAPQQKPNAVEQNPKAVEQKPKAEEQKPKVQTPKI